MDEFLSHLPAVAVAASRITATICLTVVKLRPYRQARRFGDAALRAARKKDRARIARSLARDYSRRQDRDRARAKKHKKKKKRHTG